MPAHTRGGRLPVDAGRGQSQVRYGRKRNFCSREVDHRYRRLVGMIGSYVILARRTWVNDMRRKHVRLSKAGEEKFDMRTGSEEALGMSYREVAVKLLRSNCIRLRGRERTGRRGGKGWEKTVRDGRG